MPAGVVACPWLLFEWGHRQGRDVVFSPWRSSRSGQLIFGHQVRAFLTDPPQIRGALRLCYESIRRQLADGRESGHEKVAHLVAGLSGRLQVGSAAVAAVPSTELRCVSAKGTCCGKGARGYYYYR